MGASVSRDGGEDSVLEEEFLTPCGLDGAPFEDTDVDPIERLIKLCGQPMLDTRIHQIAQDFDAAGDDLLMDLERRAKQDGFSAAADEYRRHLDFVKEQSLQNLRLARDFMTAAAYLVVRVLDVRPTQQEQGSYLSLFVPGRELPQNAQQEAERISAIVLAVRRNVEDAETLSGRTAEHYMKRRTALWLHAHSMERRQPPTTVCSSGCCLAGCLGLLSATSSAIVLGLGAAGATQVLASIPCIGHHLVHILSIPGMLGHQAVKAQLVPGSQQAMRGVTCVLGIGGCSAIAAARTGKAWNRDLEERVTAAMNCRESCTMNLELWRSLEVLFKASRQKAVRTLDALHCGAGKKSAKEVQSESREALVQIGVDILKQKQALDCFEDAMDRQGFVLRNKTDDSPLFSSTRP